MGMINSGLVGSVFNSTASEKLTTSHKSPSALGKEDFTKLLIAQIQNQNPMEPMSNTDFVAQLAQFSSVEQLNMVNSNLEDLRLYQDSINRMQASSFLGKEIRAEGNAVFLADDASAQLNYQLPENASAVKIYIYNNDLNLVRTLQLQSQPAGEHNVTWDGKDVNGTRQASGMYSFMAEAVSPFGNPINIDTFTQGKVTGLSFKGGAVNLMLDNLEIPVEKVVLVNQGGQ